MLKILRFQQIKIVYFLQIADCKSDLFVLYYKCKGGTVQCTDQDLFTNKQGGTVQCTSKARLPNSKEVQSNAQVTECFAGIENRSNKGTECVRKYGDRARRIGARIIER